MKRTEAQKQRGEKANTEEEHAQNSLKHGRLKRELRREEAIERQFARDQRSDQEQLEKLEMNGHGHCKEAEKLRTLIYG